MNIVGAVVIYEPDKEVLDNIKSYLPHIDALYVVDNSEKGNSVVVEKIQTMQKVKYFSMGGNKGVAAALNYVLKVVSNFDWLLTMDQDSCFEKGMLVHYRNKVSRIIYDKRNVAVFGVNYAGLPFQDDEPSKEVDEVITSGALVNIEVARKIGGFLEELFIDEVDHEFCYRARKAGYSVVFLPDVMLNHSLGQTTTMSIGGVRLRSVKEHAPVRRYYMARNSIYVLRKYPHVRRKKIVSIFKELLKIILAEREKGEKLSALLEGISDGIKGKMGKKNM